VGTGPDGGEGRRVTSETLSAGGDEVDRCRRAPATARNRDPILAVLEEVLPASGVVLEIGSGTGEHAVYFAPRLPRVTWQPSDASPEALESIAEWSRVYPAPNLRPPVRVDARDAPARTAATIEPLGVVTAVVSINMIHIAPWAACLGLCALAGTILSPGGILYLYGPFRRDGSHTAPSNAAFDADLRARDPAWGVRDLGEVGRAAADRGFELLDAIPMPANNLSVVFRRRARPAMP
jgi:SAM-dependent methyltransferase